MPIVDLTEEEAKALYGLIRDDGLDDPVGDRYAGLYRSALKKLGTAIRSNAQSKEERKPEA